MREDASLLIARRYVPYGVGPRAIIFCDTPRARRSALCALPRRRPWAKKLFRQDAQLARAMAVSALISRAPARLGGI